MYRNTVATTIKHSTMVLARVRVHAGAMSMLVSITVRAYIFQAAVYCIISFLLYFSYEGGQNLIKTGCYNPLTNTDTAKHELLFFTFFEFLEELLQFSLAYTLSSFEVDFVFG